jgi:poly-gamma-glutamate capsule biosynthesis protein CapA/YwtB (metallophosphatase superfamily)
VGESETKEEGVKIVLVGDVFLKRAEPEEALTGVSDVLRLGDVTFGNCEGTYAHVDSPAQASAPLFLSDPSAVSALADAGFNVMSLANNHAVDWGSEALLSTMDELSAHGIRPVGAGRTIEEAFAPVFFEVGDLRIAFVAVTTVAPTWSGATDERPGCAALNIVRGEGDSSESEETALLRSLDDASGHAEAASAERLRRAIAKASANADFVVASFHWGVHTVPLTLADHEFELGRMAIDAGADVVAGHHQHILKGVEFYKGKPIFHSLGNLAIDLPDFDVILSPEAVEHIKSSYGEYGVFKRDDYPSYPFHEDARKTVIVHLTLQDGATEVALTPCLINRLGQPTPIGTEDSLALEEFAEYLRSITYGVGLDIDVTVVGGRLLVQDPLRVIEAVGLEPASGR